jgi:HAD superfamily hydrolase (TIGR01509 family)
MTNDKQLLRSANYALQTMPMIRAILFDLDGLMVDSEPHSIASWQAVLAKRGAQFDQTALDSVLGQRVIETAQTAIRLFHLPERPEDLAQEKAEYQITHLDGNVTAMPGLIELLDFVDQAGLKKAVASSGLRRYIDAVLIATHVRDRFSVIISADDVVNGKPAPDVFLAAARALDVAPRNCLVLEDAPFGVQAAKAAGMACFAVPNAHSHALDLSLADRILPSLYDVKTILASDE